METKTIFSSNAVERIVFHYNKAHNSDATIPQWVIKHKGQTFYVNHVDSKVGFSTKETPENPHTKGSIQFRGKLKIIQKENMIIAEIE